MTDAQPNDLKLLALDAQDLQVISAFTQDAVIKVEDIGFARADRRFVLLMNRYAWERSDTRGRGVRKRAGLHFDNVLSARAEGFDLAKKDGVLELLAITFAETDAPSGEIVLVFAGGATIRLGVEALEARLRDLGAEWAAKAAPGHDLDDMDDMGGRA